MIEPGELIQYIQAMLTPIAMVSGVALVALLTQTRSGRVVDVTRRLTSEKVSLVRAKLFKNLPEPEQQFIDRLILNIDAQLAIFVRRGQYLKWCLISLLTAVLCFILTSVSILFQELIPASTSVPVTMLSFSAAMVLLLCGAILIVFDVTLSHKAINMAVEGARAVGEFSSRQEQQRTGSKPQPR